METNVTVQRATELILARATPLSTERVALSEARGRILREAALADEDSPRFDCSAVDGYALRRADAEKVLSIGAEIQAGAEHINEVKSGQCARIFTGAQVPRGADYVAMQEDVEVDDGAIRITSLSDESCIRPRGENSRRGNVVIPDGCELGAAELSALASVGVTNPLVTRRARVVHLVTGNELIDPSQAPTGTQLRDSNSTLVSAFLAERGAELARHARLPDSLEKSHAMMKSLDQEFDLLLVSGGASVGDYDFARPMLEKAGFVREFQNVNLRPGKPLALFVRDKSLAFAIPGNPVSHWVIMQLFLAPLFEAWSGLKSKNRKLTGRMAKDFSMKPNRRETHLPAYANLDDGEFRLRPLQFASSGDIGSVVGANALIEIPAGSSGFSTADRVTFRLCQR